MNGPKDNLFWTALMEHKIPKKKLKKKQKLANTAELAEKYEVSNKDVEKVRILKLFQICRLKTYCGEAEKECMCFLVIQILRYTSGIAFRLRKSSLEEETISIENSFLANVIVIFSV